MNTYLYIFLGLSGLIIIAVILWRVTFRHPAHPCPVWLIGLLELNNPFSNIYRSDVIIEHSGLRPGMVVLDIGCGAGRVTIPAARKVGQQGQVVAVDLQAGMLRRAQTRAEAKNLTNIRFIQAEAGKTQLQDSSSDMALLVTVLGEIPNREAALREIYNALKPGGILSVTETIFDPHFQSRDKVLKLAGAVGFREKAFFGNRFIFTLSLEKP